MSRDHYEHWACPYCATVNAEVRYSNSAPGYYTAGQWYPDDLPAIRCQRCEFNTTWLAVDTDHALARAFKDPDSHPFGKPIGN
jgi:hypothetical protein